MSQPLAPALPSAAPCAVVHDAARGVWLRFTNPRRIVCASRVEDVLAALRDVERAVAEDRQYAVGYVAYEASPAFDPALTVRPSAGFPLLWFGLFDAPAEETSLPPAPGGTPAIPEDWQPTVDTEAYAVAISAVKDAIREGETYQVNYTYRLYAPGPDEPWSAFLHVAEAQRAGYGAYLATGEWTLCSASPELFFRRAGRVVESMPMKGTARRGPDSASDQLRRDELLASEKERAEHLMIVDMVRNDLGRVADAGGVTVPELLTAEAYPTVWQLTSTVRATTDASLAELFGALFPPSSITGAPKRRTMELIASLESTPRRVYTGTIGFVLPDGRAQFNVAIRTLLCDLRARRCEYGLGGGIVWDSDARSERRECELKARILTTRHPEFDLLETLLWTLRDGFALLDRHLRRLARSAAYFGYVCDLDAVRRELACVAERWDATSRRVRLLVARRGGLRIEAAVLADDGGGAFADPVLDCETIDLDDPFLYHKTTHREVYGAALARNPGAEDVLLRNPRGEITEGTRANLVYRRQGRLWTPPVACGLLAGTYREWLLSTDRVAERALRVEELPEVEALYFANSVRGLHRIALKNVELQH